MYNYLEYLEKEKEILIETRIELKDRLGDLEKTLKDLDQKIAIERKNPRP